MIQKQAIMYNLAGYARNNPDGTVGVRLQGDKDRMDKTARSHQRREQKDRRRPI